MGNFAAGYPVVENGILTAGKVLSSLRDGGQILVRWPGQTDSDGGTWRPIKRIAWQGGVNVDAALIECEFPKAVADRFGEMARSEPKPDTFVNGLGFADYGARDAPPPPTPLNGRIVGKSRTAFDFEIPAISLGALQQGASGSPLFDNAGLIIGVVDSWTQGDNNPVPPRRMIATADLLAIPTFSSALARLREESERKWLAVVTAKIFGEVDGAPEVKACLEAELELGDVVTSTLVDLLLAMDAAPLMEHLKAAYGGLKSMRLADAASVVARIACLILPARYLVDDARRVRRESKDARQFMTVVGGATVTAAEFIMAGAGRRSAKFQSADPGKPQPIPGYAVSLEGGRKSAPTTFFKQLGRQLATELMTADEIAGLDRENDGREPDRSINRRLAIRKGFYYHIVGIADEARSHPDWNAELEKFKKRYTAFMFVMLSINSDALDRDDNIFGDSEEMFLECT